MPKLSYNPLNVSIGIHYGAAVLIPIDPSKPNFLTPLGDIVNSVARIEAANLEVGSDLLVSESIYQQVKDKAIINRSGSLTLQKSEFKVYEVTGMQGNPPKVAKVEASNAPAPKRFMSFIQKFLSK